MFCIKKALIEKIIGGRKKKQPFDYEKAEAYTFEKAGDGANNNSYYFSAHSLDKKESFYVRLGLRDNGRAEAWVFYLNENKRYYLKEAFYDLDNCPLKVAKENGNWRFSFEGNLIDKNGKEVFVKTDCTYFSDKGVVDFFAHMPTCRVATAMAQDKWGKGYFDEVQKNNSVHYEQEGVLKGRFEVDGEKIEIDLPCLRDHSYGRRVWGYMNNHLWLAGIDKDCQFNFSMVSYPAMSILEVGHLRERDREVEFVTKANYDRSVLITDEVPKSLELELEIDKKRTVKVTAELIEQQEYIFDGGDYRFIEGIADLVVDGIKCRGILEVGFNKDKSRFMNGKKIEKLKA